MALPPLRRCWPCAASFALVLAAAAHGYEAGSVANGGTLSGVVRFSGTPPTRAALPVNKDLAVCGATPKLSTDLVIGPDGGVQWAVLSLRGVTHGKPFATGTPVLEQHGCEYTPHVVLVPAGVELEIRNSDGILHNVRTASTRNAPINRAQPKFRTAMPQRFVEPERVEVRCDVHPWMRGWVIVQDHPYFAVSDAQGGFSLTEVPPGDYELHLWHETLGEQVRPVTITGGADLVLSIALPPK